MLKPEYCKNVIVGVIYRKKFCWYVTSKELWYLDYCKRYAMWEELYKKLGRSDKQFKFDVGSFEEYCEKRFNIQILDVNTANTFLKEIEQFKVTANELKNIFEKNKNEDRITFMPTFVVNFDKKYFYSDFPEFEKFEDYVPVGWSGVREKLQSIIPDNQIFWN